MALNVQYSVFTKPYKDMSLEELADKVKSLGFDGVELPVRPGYQVEPDKVEEDLPKAAKALESRGLRIFSVATSSMEIDEAHIRAAGASGKPALRMMPYLNRPDRGQDESYTEMEDRFRKNWDDHMSLLEEYDVAVGVQNHCGNCVSHAMGLWRLVKDYDVKRVYAVYDPAHCALEGEQPNLAFDILWPHIGMINLKNAIKKQMNGPEAEIARWGHYWTSGRKGLCPWHEVAEEMKKRKFEGVICLPAEYSDESLLEELIAEDLTYVKELLA